MPVAHPHAVSRQPGSSFVIAAKAEAGPRPSAGVTLAKAG